MHVYKSSLEAGDSTLFEEILQLPDRPFWIKACKNEIQNFINHDVFELVKRPEDADILIISNKWVFKYKRGLKNQILKRKARYIMRDFIQCYK